MKFLWDFLQLAVACNKVLKYIVRVLDGIIFCDVSVPADYNPNIVACADMFNEFGAGVFQRGTSASSRFGFGCI